MTIKKRIFSLLLAYGLFNCYIAGMNDNNNKKRKNNDFDQVETELKDILKKYKTTPNNNNNNNNIQQNCYMQQNNNEGKKIIITLLCRIREDLQNGKDIKIKLNLFKMYFINLAGNNPELTKILENFLNSLDKNKIEINNNLANDNLEENMGDDDENCNNLMDDLD